ncbi:MAG: ribosomal protein S18-alanine N-acetyltransferase [Bacilli bacterium]|jgi:ribosomal-protein-alanine N-acetyltransferase|nr:ribosomal protein S18-alanine N-acetyltransferase [Bacilli bacterium]
MSVEINLRLMESKDLNRVLEIENESFLSPWKRQDLLYELNENPINVIYVLEVIENSTKEIAGFIDFMITFSSSTISQIAVAKKYRNMQVGSKLLNRMIEHLKSEYDEEVETITLEVRTHNKTAIAFYEKYGFEAVMIKPDYYSNGDDALYMIRRLI